MRFPIKFFADRTIGGEAKYCYFHPKFRATTEKAFDSLEGTLPVCEECLKVYDNFHHDFGKLPKPSDIKKAKPPEPTREPVFIQESRIEEEEFNEKEKSKETENKVARKSQLSTKIKENLLKIKERAVTSFLFLMVLGLVIWVLILNNQISKLQNDLFGYSRRSSSSSSNLEGRVETLEGNFQDLDSRTTVLEGDTSDLKDRMDTAEGTLSDIDDDLNDLCSRVPVCTHH